MSTVVAISTAVAQGAIAIVRLSGDRAGEIADKMFSKNVSGAVSHLMQYGFVIDEAGRAIDQCLCVIMRGPRSFTGEDVVEIHSHGGYAAPHRILKRALELGAELAGPGEFSKRAFLNGKMDLIRAEAIIDIINAKTNNALEIGVTQLGGALSRQLQEIRQRLMNLCAMVHVSLDYPEELSDGEQEQISEQTSQLEEIRQIKALVHGLIGSFDYGRLATHGAVMAIIGAPNSGKSSLMNCLLQADRSIVTSIEGTTRDVVEDFISINGIQIRIGDTAGIRNTHDITEKIGVEKTKEYIEKADFCLVVIDSSKAVSKNENYLDEIFSMLFGKKYLIAFNKCDLPKGCDFSDIGAKVAAETSILKVSAKNGLGIDELKDAIYNLLVKGCNVEEHAQNHGIITNLRQHQALLAVRQCLWACEETLTNNMPYDLLAQDLEQAIATLGIIDGQSVTDQIIDQIFNSFCVGK